MVLVKPATVVRWHRQGFRLFWRWRSEWCRTMTMPRSVKSSTVFSQRRSVSVSRLFANTW